MSVTTLTTVVFTDLVGSTDLAARLGPAATEALRSVHVGLLREAVSLTGGTEVKNVGDGLMVAYAGVGAALDGAVAMQQCVERYNRTAPVLLRIRVGLSSGDVAEVDGDYFGEPVVEAARLCGSAEGGQILTTDMVRMLARRSDHHFAPIGALELKGLPQPLDTCEVLWDPIKLIALVPLPSRMELKPDTGVIGRSWEADRLRSVQKAAFAGEGHRVVLMAGEPGVGKTTLAGELGQRAHAEGATVLYGRCEEDLGRPYQPFVEALGGFVANAPLAALESLDERQLSEASRLLPQIRERLPMLAAPPSTEPDAERYLLFGAVTAVVKQIASTAPVVLVIDDLHWADKPAVLLLRHLVATLEQADVLVVATYRDTDLDPTHPFADALASLRREPSVERLAIKGLDDAGVVALLQAFAGHDLDRSGIELAHVVHRETNGNPFFAAEVLRHLAETSAIRQEDGRWVASVDPSRIGLPDSVREVVGQRVRRLGEGAQVMLKVAAVLGREFDLGLLSRAAECDVDQVLDVLDAAAASQIVAEVDGRVGRFTFTHALFQHTLYDELSASRRRRTHRRIGELLESDCGDEPGDRIGELAHHWIAAASLSDARKAASYARRAGEWALASLAPDEAIRWFGALWRSTTRTPRSRLWSASTF